MRMRHAGHRIVFRRPALVFGMLAVLASCLQASAAVLTPDDAAATVLAHGFSFVAKTEAGGASRPEDAAFWNVWASKYGIAYRVTVDAITGDLTEAAPAVEND